MALPGEEPRELLPGAEGVSAPAERPVEATNPPAAGEDTGQNGILEAEIIEEPAAAMLVDQPGGPAPPMPWSGPIARPIFAPWLIDAQQRAQFARWLAWYVRHWTLYHTVHLPLYALRTLGYAPVGAAKLTTRAVGYVTDHETAPLRAAATRKEDAEEWLKIARVRADRVRFRRVGAAVVLVLLAAGGVALQWAPAWAQAIIVVVLVAFLAKVGQPKDRPIIGPAVVVPKVQPLRSEHVERALSSLGIAALAKGEGIGWPDPIGWTGNGWRAVVELPIGVVAADVIERRDRLASGLRRPLGAVWPEASPEHPGRLTIWVGVEDMAKAKQPAWPLARTGTVDLFGAVPFGTDPRSRAVPLELMYSNLLVGSLPGAGKTMSIRIPLLAAALDPTAELRVWELKGSGDLAALERVSYRYGSGVDDATIEACLLDLRDVHKELERRAKTIASLPRDLAPENKVVKELAAKRSLRLWPLVVAVDECQELFSHPDFGKEAGELCEKIIKRGRALGVILLLATQRPDSKGLPTGISANVGIRFCLRVMGQIENDMILGTSMYRNGVRATMLSPRDKGIGFLVGASVA